MDVISIVAIVVIARHNVNISYNNVTLSALVLANVEALADPEVDFLHIFVLVKRRLATIPSAMKYLRDIDGCRIP